MSEAWVDEVELHKREMRRIMAEIWRRYDRIPQGSKKKAKELIEAWFNDQITYEELLRRLEQLPGQGKSSIPPGPALRSRLGAGPRRPPTARPLPFTTAPQALHNIIAYSRNASWAHLGWPLARWGLAVTSRISWRAPGASLSFLS